VPRYISGSLEDDSLPIVSDAAENAEKYLKKCFPRFFPARAAPLNQLGQACMSYIHFFSQAQVEFSEVDSRDRLGEVSKKNQLEKGN